MKEMMMTLLALAFIVAGCGGGLSEDEANEAFATTQAALSQGQTQAYTEISAQNSGDSGTVTSDVEISCQAGGAMTWSGEWSYNNSEFTSWNAQATFNGCNFQGVTMNGTINYTYSGETSGDTSTIKYTMKGTVNYSGNISGSCTYDVTWTLSTNSSGANFSYSGSYCGYNASSFGNVSSPF